jgi:hypothetical protein
VLRHHQWEHVRLHQAVKGAQPLFTSTGEASPRRPCSGSPELRSAADDEEAHVPSGGLATQAASFLDHP